MPNLSVPAAGGALPTAQPTTFLAVTPTMRLRIATTIENLIALLDDIDGDENLEPYLAGFAGGDDDREYDGGDDREGDDEREADPAECGIADLDALGYLPAGFEVVSC
jgi:hypothetical protein